MDEDDRTNETKKQNQSQPHSVYRENFWAAVSCGQQLVRTLHKSLAEFVLENQLPARREDGTSKAMYLHDKLSSYPALCSAILTLS